MGAFICMSQISSAHLKIKTLSLSVEFTCRVIFVVFVTALESLWQGKTGKWAALEDLNLRKAQFAEWSMYISPILSLNIHLVNKYSFLRQVCGKDLIKKMMLIYALKIEQQNARLENRRGKKKKKKKERVLLLLVICDPVTQCCCDIGSASC